MRNKEHVVVDYATVSATDADLINKHKWSIKKGRKTDYAQTRINNKPVVMHELLVGEVADGYVIDHKDQNGFNNTRPNLRIATLGQNGQNGPLRGGTSEYRGVSWHRQNKKWRTTLAQVGYGQYEQAEQAAKVYDQVALAVYGADAAVNGFLTAEETSEAVKNPEQTLAKYRKERKLPKGVHKKPEEKRFLALIRWKGKLIHLGRHDTIEGARQAYLAKHAEFVAIKVKEHYAKPIRRNIEGVACIPIQNRNGKIHFEALVSDEDWHPLTLSAWCNSDGYCVGKVDGVQISMHRLLVPNAFRVDHRNQVRHDNRRSNLRATDGSGNGQNRVGSGISCFKGVHLNRKRWVAEISKDGVKYRLGSFVEEIDAARAYNTAAMQLYEAPYLNRVEMKFENIMFDEVVAGGVAEEPEESEADSNPDETSPDSIEKEEVVSRMASDTPDTESDEEDDVEPSTSNPNISDGSTRGKRRENTTSKFLGVSRYLSGEYVYWAAECRSGKTRLRKGGFKSEEEAALEFNKMAKELYDDPKLNIVAQADIPEEQRRRRTTSSYTGVTFDKKVSKWSVSITHQKKTQFLGYFLEENQAALAYNKKASRNRRPAQAQCRAGGEPLYRKR